MDDKSVFRGSSLSLVCGSLFDTGSLLLDRRLRTSMTHHPTTGGGLCPEHQALFDEGLGALVECDPTRSSVSTASLRLEPEEAYRMGRIAHLRRGVLTRLLDVRLDDLQAFVLVEPGAIARLEAMVSAQGGLATRSITRLPCWAVHRWAPTPFGLRAARHRMPAVVAARAWRN